MFQISFISIFLFMFSLIESSSAGEFTTGVGYINPEEYRVDNDINPLPLGINILPLISYRSENLSIRGPNISYHLLKGAIGLKLDFVTIGDRYKSQEVDERSSTINVGATLRLLFLSMKYGSDVFNVYNGNVFSVVLAKPFHISKQFMFIPRFGKEYLNASYTNYYFGVKNSEVGAYQAYETKTAANTVAGLTAVYRMSEKSSLTLSLSQRKFDQVIYNSPTVNKRSYNTYALFWAFSI